MSRGGSGTNPSCGGFLPHTAWRDTDPGDGPVQRSIEQDGVVEQVRHFVRGTGQAVEQPEKAKRPAAEDADRRLVRTGRGVDQADKRPRRDGIRPGDMHRLAVGSGRVDELQQGFRRVVDEDELVGSIRVERPSARLARQGALEDRPEDLVHDAGAVEVRVSREDEAHPPIPVGLEEQLLDAHAQPSLLRVRFLWVVFRHGSRPGVAIDVHVAWKSEGGAFGLRGCESVVREPGHEPRPLGVRAIRRVDDEVGAPGRRDDRFLGLQIGMDDLHPGGESVLPRGRPDHRADLLTREPSTPDDRPSDRTFRAKHDNLHAGPTAWSPDKADGRGSGGSTYVHDACTRPPYAREATVSRRPASVRRARCERWETESNWGRARRSSWSSCWRRVRWAS